MVLPTRFMKTMTASPLGGKDVASDAGGGGGGGGSKGEEVKGVREVHLVILSLASWTEGLYLYKRIILYLPYHTQDPLVESGLCRAYTRIYSSSADGLRSARLCSRNRSDVHHARVTNT